MDEWVGFHFLSKCLPMIIISSSPEKNLKDLNKRKSKKEYLKELILVVNFPEQFLPIQAFFEEKGVRTQPGIEHHLNFKRKTYTKFCCDSEQWVPCPLLIENEDYPIMMYEADELCPIAHTLTPKCFLILIQGLEKYKKNNRNLGSIDIIFSWRILHGVQILCTKNIDETILYLDQFALELAAKRYQMEICPLKSKSGGSLTDTWRLMLIGIRGITDVVADAIIFRFPTINAMYKALEQEQDPIKMLEDIRITEKRRIGPSLASKIHLIFTSRDPNLEA